MSFLSVRELCVSIGGVRLIDAVSFDIERGRVLGLVGESGSGKSLTAMAIMGLLPLIGGQVSGGSIQLDGQELVGLAPEPYRQLRGRRMAFISQNPMTSLDPMVPVGEQVDQMARLHLGQAARLARTGTIALLDQLRIPNAAMVCLQYPHQLSGGMKQRVVIAMALAAGPELIVADEPTTALDVTIQAQIVQLLADLVRERRLSLMLITHDMGVVAQVCDDVVVLYAGRVAESQSVAATFATPAHPYTRALIGCIARTGQPSGSLTGIPGIVPGVTRSSSLTPGCRFAPRCEGAQARCGSETPALRPLGLGRVACHFALHAGHG